MELPETTIKQLDLLLNSSGAVSDKNFNQLLEIVASNTIGQNFDKNTLESLCNINNNEKNATKAAYYDLVSLFVEAARNKFDSNNLSTYLNSINISSPRAKQLLELYGQNSQNIVGTLSSIGDCLPCIVDVDIRTDFCIMQSTDGESDECLFHVRLTTKKHGKIDYLTFSCTTLQLQQLLYRLRDAIRHMEKMTITN